MIDASLQVANKDDVPMPTAEAGDVPASGAELTILQAMNLRKGPYARCCECDVRWLYDKGLENKGKPCACECSADKDNCVYCDDQCGVEADWTCVKENMYSDEEKHLEIQQTSTCCRDDFLERKQPVDYSSPSPPLCSATFIVKGDIAVNLWQQHHAQHRTPLVMCSVCAEQYASLACTECNRIFVDEEQLEEHNKSKHSDLGTDPFYDMFSFTKGAPPKGDY
jgi:hypothetical protein